MVIDKFQETEEKVYEITVAIREGGERVVLGIFHDRAVAEAYYNSFKNIPMFQFVGLTTSNVRTKSGSIVV